jgi:hypothetical protein
MENQSNLPATMPTSYDDGWSDIDANDRVIQGDLLKCIDGVWTVDGLPAPKQLLPLATITALQLWKGQKPVQTLVKGRVNPWPNIDDLNAEIPQEEWEVGLDGKLREPWQRQFIVYLLDPETAASFTYANGTTGANRAVADLKNAIKWQRQLRGDHVVPLIELSNKPMPTKFGQKLRPHFQIIEWRNLDVGFSAAAPQLSLPTPAVADSGAAFDDEIPFTS